MGADAGATPRYHLSKKQADDALRSLPNVQVAYDLRVAEGANAKRIEKEVVQKAA